MVPKLTIELVPRTSWFTNLRSILSGEDWDRIRRATYLSANFICQICGGRGVKHPVECHEIWQYDDLKHHQTLTGLIALCPDCHRVKHIGLAKVQGFYSDAVRHLAKVNEWSIGQAESYICSAFEQWKKRNAFTWTIDISIITSC